MAGADFFTTEVWTWRGLVASYTVFVIDLASRRIQILGSTRHPAAIFMHQVVRQLTFADEGLLESSSATVRTAPEACACKWHARSLATPARRQSRDRGRRDRGPERG